MNVKLFLQEARRKPRQATVSATVLIDNEKDSNLAGFQNKSLPKLKNAYIVP